MQRGLMTEYEWRKQAQRAVKTRPDWWGAQCVYPSGRHKLMKDRSFWLFLWMLSLSAALMIPLLFPMKMHENFADYASETEDGVQARKVSAISYQLPTQLDYQQQTFTRAQLLTGRMLLIDAQHPLPDDSLPPNTASIAQYGSGMVPVRSLTIRSGHETIDALKSLFVQLRARGVQGLYVSQGTVSSAQQRELLNEQARRLMTEHSPAESSRLALDALDWPGTGSLLQEYTVEIHPADEQRLEDCPQGQTLLQLCWRSGFVRESDSRPNRFRYVGKAHAAAMTYLDLDFENYLKWLHQQGVIVISAGGQPQYLILCKPMQGDYAAFDLPVNAEWEISMDNTGYALAACIL